MSDLEAIVRSDDRVAREFAARRARGESLALARAALEIATDNDPELDIDAYLGTLDDLAAGIAPQFSQVNGLREKLLLLTSYLCEEQGFRGSSDEYYAPENSYLSHVMESRHGLPITLSVVYVEVARRLGMTLQGVGFPAHFLLRAGDPPIFIDAFNGGALLNERDCEDLLHRMTGGRVRFHPELLAPVTTDEVILRILRNLKLLHVRDGRAFEALRMVDRLIAIDPMQMREYRDRGLLCMEQADWKAAIEDLSFYLGHVRGPKDELFVRAKLALATQRHYSVN